MQLTKGNYHGKVSTLHCRSSSYDTFGNISLSAQEIVRYYPYIYNVVKTSQGKQERHHKKNQSQQPTSITNYSISSSSFHHIHTNIKETFKQLLTKNDILGSCARKIANRKRVTKKLLELKITDHAEQFKLHRKASLIKYPQPQLLTAKPEIPHKDSSLQPSNSCKSSIKPFIPLKPLNPDSCHLSLINRAERLKSFITNQSARANISDLKNGLARISSLKSKISNLMYNEKRERRALILPEA